MNLGNDRLFALMGAVVAILLVALAVAQEIPGWGRWCCLGLGLVLLMLMVGAIGSSRLELLESQQALKRARNQRDVAERYFNALMDHLPSWIYFKDRESKFIQVNKALADYSGMTPEEMIGQSDAEFLDPENAKKNREDEIQILASGKGKERFIEKENLEGGGDAWVLTSKLPLRDKKGRTIGTFGVSSNITEMVEAQNALEKERNTLRTLLDSIPDGIYIRDDRGKYRVANKALAEFVGAESPADVVGKTPYDFFPNEHSSRFLADDKAVMDKQEVVVHNTYKMLNSSGAKRHIITTKVPIKDKDGQVSGILGINRDVTEQEKAREALRQTEHRMQEIVDNSPSPMYAKSVTGKYLMVNRRFEELFNVKAAEVVGKTDLEVIGDSKVVQRLQKNDSLVIKRGEPLQFDETLTVKDEQRNYVSMKFPMRDLRGDIYAVGGISTDITVRKQAEKELQKLNQELMQTHENLTSAHEQLIQAEKMESVGRLAAGVAHEVKNPLAMIGMGLELLARRLPEDDSKGQDTIERMKRGIDRAKKIVRGLVDYSSDRRIDLQSHDPNRLVTEALELIEYQLVKSGITIDFTPGENLPNVEADQTKIEQVLVNIFINAMHAMEGGGTLTIRTQLVSMENVAHDEGSRLKERIREGDQMIRIHVTDTGKGIPEEVLNKLFDPFFTTKATGKGTGLGLTVSRKIAELHGGELLLANRDDGRGASATLTLKVMKE
ncbi:PAS domain-containing protein [Verrucomicrobiaceae bacterium R5-34]|nr:PAS domain-containing protein [Verrucomicrobiaceae bacterium R5-34]